MKWQGNCAASAAAAAIRGQSVCELAFRLVHQLASQCTLQSCQVSSCQKPFLQFYCHYCCYHYHTQTYCCYGVKFLFLIFLPYDWIPHKMKLVPSMTAFQLLVKVAVKWSQAATSNCNDFFKTAASLSPYRFRRRLQE